MKNQTHSNARTLKYLRELDWTVELVEHYNIYSKQKNDLFGFIDILALCEYGVVGVQACGKDWQAHIRKIQSEPRAVKWLQAGGKILLIGWRKLKVKRGGKVERWTPRLKWIDEKDFEAHK